MPSAPLRPRPFVVYEQDIVDERRLIAALYEWLIDVYPLPPRAALDEGFKLKVEEETLHEVLGSALLAHLLPDESLRETQAMRHPALDVSYSIVLLNERRLGARLLRLVGGLPHATGLVLGCGSTLSQSCTVSPSWQGMTISLSVVVVASTSC